MFFAISKKIWNQMITFHVFRHLRILSHHWSGRWNFEKQIAPRVRCTRFDYFGRTQLGPTTLHWEVLPEAKWPILYPLLKFRGFKSADEESTACQNACADRDSSFCSHDNSLHSMCRHRGPISTRVHVIRIPTIGGPFCILLPYFTQCAGKIVNILEN